ncbi:MAG: hypothetical protein O2873_11415, partial [Proteobacteria bacterium]|nr:hypothetical protein [Pseudomonadota bacterium]
TVYTNRRSYYFHVVEARETPRGAPYTFVTTEQFLVAFGLESLRDLPDTEQMRDAGLEGG